MCPTFKPGKDGQASTVAPSTEKWNPPCWIGKKGGPREYTHIHMVCTRGHEDRGDSNDREEEMSRPTSVDSPIEWDAVYLIQK